MFDFISPVQFELLLVMDLISIIYKFTKWLLHKFEELILLFMFSMHSQDLPLHHNLQEEVRGHAALS